ncbi:MAG: hypothetical protein Q7T33_05635 [Dehalococcoidia bacterium]|nr:hypothetical protein [Dehalococcoidia bacterium]
MLWVGQFGIADGEAREETPWVGAFPDPGRTEEPSDLYLIVEPALPGSEEFCAEMKEAIGAVFHKNRVSLTGGILGALRSAHENLRDWNRRSMKDSRVAAGVSCVAVQGRAGYLAQVGPAAAVIYRDGALELRRPALPDALEPLGLFEEFWPDFSRLELAAGFRLLLLTPALLETVPAAELAAALALPPEDALPAVYKRARALPNCAALLLAQD